MTLEKYSPNEVAAPNQKASWSQVKYWANIAGKFQQASLAAQVMAGFTLAELKKNFSAQGARNDLTSPHDAEKLGWEQSCIVVGLSEDTSRRWIAMADGIKARWKKLAPQERLRELMRVPVSDWTDADTKLVSDSLAKVTDGATQLEFMRELGLATKKPGNKTHDGRVAPGKLGATAKAERAKADALEFSGRLGEAVKWANESFMLLDDLEVTCQVSVLETALKFRRAWLLQPAGKRNPDLIIKMMRDLK